MNDEQLDVTVNLSIHQNPNDTYSTCNKVSIIKYKIIRI